MRPTLFGFRLQTIWQGRQKPHRVMAHLPEQLFLRTSPDPAGRGRANGVLQAEPGLAVITPVVAALLCLKEKTNRRARPVGYHASPLRSNPL